MRIGASLFVKDSIICSMTWMKELAHQLPHGTVLVARDIANAHGRSGRRWQVWPGQLLLTILLKPTETQIAGNVDRALASINMFSGVACVQGLAPYVPCVLKWPNDIVHNGKKVGGILLETVWSGGCIEAIVCGIGLNINVPSSAFTIDGVTSVQEITQKNHDLTEVRSSVLDALEEQYVRWSRGDHDAIFTAWKSYQAYLGHAFTVHSSRGARYEYVMDDVLPSGDALVHTPGDLNVRVQRLRYCDV